MYKLIFTDSYTRRAIRFMRKHGNVRPQYEKALRLLELNPYHPSLRLHKLKGRLHELHSVSINLTFRITILFLIKDDTIIPIDVGSHDDIYS